MSNIKFIVGIRLWEKPHLLLAAPLHDNIQREQGKFFYKAFSTNSATSKAEINCSIPFSLIPSPSMVRQ